MPKLITTRTRIAYLGKPRTTIIGGGFAGLEVAKELETSSIVFPFRRRFKNDDFFFRLGDVLNPENKQNYLAESNRWIIARSKDGVN